MLQSSFNIITTAARLFHFMPNSCSQSLLSRARCSECSVELFQHACAPDSQVCSNHEVLTQVYVLPHTHPQPLLARFRLVSLRQLQPYFLQLTSLHSICNLNQCRLLQPGCFSSECCSTQAYHHSAEQLPMDRRRPYEERLRGRDRMSIKSHCGVCRIRLDLLALGCDSALGPGNICRNSLQREPNSQHSFICPGVNASCFITLVVWGLIRPGDDKLT